MKTSIPWYYKLILISLLLIIGVCPGYSQTNNLSGIKFNSQNVERSKKTSLFLNENNPIELDGSFSIAFDISFWNYKKFGPILRMQDNDGNEFRIVYSPFKDQDTSLIELIEPFKKKSISLKIPKKNLIRNNWFNLKLTFDKSSKKIKIYYNNIWVSSIEYKVINKNNYKFVFGIKDINNINDFDVPAISIKNIIISENNEAKYFWKLNPFQANPLIDNINNSKITASNPAWVYTEHQKWRKVSDFNISNTSISPLGVAFDSGNHRLFIDRKDDLLIYNLVTGKDSILKYKSKSPAYWSDLFYDDEKQVLYSYFTGLGKVSVYDLHKKEWIVNEPSKNPNGVYFGSAKFSYSESDNLLLLGGYGLYKAKNELLSYDFKKQKWVRINLKKNEMSPRAWLCFGRGFKDGEYLIYGGLGNESGNQELGFKSNYDLYLLNMQDSTITKLKLPEHKFNYAMLFNDAYLDKEDSSFYFLSQNEDGKGISISLNKLDLKTGKVIPIGNKFWERSANKWMYSYLHYNKATNEFISVIFDSTKVELFSINFPPISESQKTYLANLNVDKNYSSILLIGVAGLISLAAVLIYYKRRKFKLSKNRITNSLAVSETDTVINHPQNSIKLFGGFRIYDKEGNDIAQTLSPKLKEIFLLILLRSLSNRHIGITSEELSSIIWPDASPESGKSNRGVAINKLRKILSSVDGIDLEFSDKLWTVKINNGLSCDYAEYLKFCSNNKNGNDNVNDQVIMLIRIVSRGEFLKGISYEWLDSIKFSINNEVIGYLKQYCDREKAGNNDETLLKLCDVILAFDSVDTDAIKFKIKTLTFQGKLHIAKSTYGLFVAEYKRLYDENYPLSFEEIIKS